jgi:hypothetical protein
MSDPRGGFIALKGSFGRSKITAREMERRRGKEQDQRMAPVF